MCFFFFVLGFFLGGLFVYAVGLIIVFVLGFFFCVCVGGGGGGGINLPSDWKVNR